MFRVAGHACVRKFLESAEVEGLRPLLFGFQREFFPDDLTRQRSETS